VRANAGATATARAEAGSSASLRNDKEGLRNDKEGLRNDPTKGPVRIDLSVGAGYTS
jgi:hypothetical protein